MTLYERLDSIANHIDTLSQMQIETETRLQRLEEVQRKTETRINRLFTVTLKIGADFSERLRKLEEEE